MNWYYYLHTNGDIIGKRPDNGREQDFRESPFVIKYWLIDTTDRKDAWILAIESLALGARNERVRELAKKWQLSEDDLMEFIIRHKPTELQKKGMQEFIKNILTLDPEIFWDNLSRKKNSEGTT